MFRDPEAHAKLDRILRELAAVRRHLGLAEEQIMSALDDLTAQVKANTDAEASAVQCIQGLAQKLAEAGTDPAKLSALQSELQASAANLAAAIVANTPAAPPAPPAPAPAPAAG